MTGSPENNADEFIELYNPTDLDSDVSACSIQYLGGNSSTYSKKNFASSSTIPSHGYFLVAHGEDYSGTITYDMSWSQSFSESGGTIFLVNSEESLGSLKNNDLYIIDTLGYGEAKESEQDPAIKPIPGQSISRKNFLDSNNNLADFIPSLPSPKEAVIEIFEEDTSLEEILDNETGYYSSDIRLNEILPNPKGEEKDGEYIELYNDSDSSIDLKDWILKDLSKTKFVFPAGHILKPNEYLTIYRDTFKFALNNTGSEEVFLLDPEENIISQASYESAKENVSFSFDGSGWRWSKYLTPSKANRLGSSSKIKLEKIKEGYIGVPVEFSLDPEYDNFSKVTWDFGDKKKSYLKNPTHTYLKKGNYKIRVSASGEAEDVSDSFTLKIKDYPRENVEIVSLLPNPFGNDAGQEWIEIRNNGGEIVNLKGWKLSAGQKTLVNHLIKNDLEIGPGETVQLTRDQAFFTLHNTGMALELRYPDGKTADKVSYAKTKIADDEIYIKEESGWIWFSAEEDMGNEEVLDFEEAEPSVEPETPREEDSQGEVLGDSTELGKFSFSEEWENKKRNMSHYLNYGLRVKLAYVFSNKIYPNNSLSAKSLPAHAENETFLEINAFLNKLFFN